MGDKPYILAHGDFNSLQEVRTPLGQIELLNQLSEQLRYNSGSVAAPGMKWEAIKKCSEQIRPFFIDLDALPENVDHIEVFLNPSELALLPFELLLNKKEEPHFVLNDGKQLVLTRNFRRAEPATFEIPKNPRILFVHTKPDHKNFMGLPFPDVPHKNHAQSLRYALRHWDIDNRLTVLANPDFDTFSQTVLEAEAKNNPFTHIHILAHGSMLFDPKRPQNFEYGIAFHSNLPKEAPYKPTSTREIKLLFESMETLPYLVNYMICDGANFTNGTKSDKNPVQATFEAGVPVVIGSQFPLSMDGSNLITKELYKRLLRGGDIRNILGGIRTKLYGEKPAEHHDWISLVSYVNLPDNYEFQLLLQKLESQLVILNSIRNKARRENTDTLPSKDDFIRAKVQIEESIADLSAQVQEIEHQKSKEFAFLENSGLLGSAYKRLAEIEFKEFCILGSETQSKQIQYLQEAKKWYKIAADRNLSHHWSSIQYISLCSILEGGLIKEEYDYWNAARLAALTEIELNTANGKKSVWAHGTLLELYLLTSSERPNESKKKIMENIKHLVSHAKSRKKPEAIASTKFQILRYLEWWGSTDFKIPEQLLAKDSKFLNLILKQLCI